MKNILTVGSINMDMVINTKRLPKVGETVAGSGFATVPGGKGANQAVSAARLGGNVKFIGRVGSDIYGAVLREELVKNGVGDDGVGASDGCSGIAVITVCDGDNQIILERGANFDLTPNIILQNAELFKWADIVLLQLEIPIESVLCAAREAKKNNALVLLNPAPMAKLPEELLELTDIIVPNRHEAAAIIGEEIEGIDGAHAALKKIREAGIGRVIITLGSDGCIYNIGDEVFTHGIIETPVVDTTGAGDSFIGGLAFCLCKGLEMDEAVAFATAVSAITVSGHGASPSFPTLARVEALLAKNG